METNVMIILFMVLTLAALIIGFWDDFMVAMRGNPEDDFMNAFGRNVDDLIVNWDKNMEEIRNGFAEIRKALTDTQKIIKGNDK